jgi:hypothetical protein
MRSRLTPTSSRRGAPGRRDSAALTSNSRNAATTTASTAASAGPRGDTQARAREPLLRQDFAELYEFARRLGLMVTIFTNARLITPELADLLARMPPLESIEVTVYGMTEQSYEPVARAKGSYVQFMRGVALLRERAIPLVVKGALPPPNRTGIAAFEEWAAAIPAMERPPGYAMFFDLRSRRDSEARNELIRSARVSAADGVALIARDREAYVREMRAFRARFIGPPGDALVDCVSLLGVVAPSLCAGDEALMLAVHASTHQWEQLEQILTFALVLAEMTEQELLETIAEARAQSCRRRFVIGCILARAMLGVRLPAAVEECAAADPAAAHLAAGAGGRLFREDPAALDTRPDRIFQLIARIFVPGAADWDAVHLPRGLCWLYYLVWPLRVLGFFRGRETTI